MQKVFVTSDHHFYHEKIIQFQKEEGTRPFETVEEMNEKLIDRWNKTVGPNDTVYILGDFSFGNSHKTETVLYQLNGKKHLVIGNHDDHWLKADLKTYFESIQNYLEYRYKKLSIVMFHYPIAQWNKMHHGSLHLHGHTHGHYKSPGRIMDVGIDARPNCDYDLWNMEEVVEILLTKEVLKHH